MKLASYVYRGTPGFGIVRDGGIVTLADRLPDVRDLRDLLAQERLRELGAFATASPDLARDDVTLLPPIPEPSKILCVGVNYVDRNQEYRDGSEAPAYPSLFVRFPQSFVGDRAPLVRPRESTQLDYEGEIALVIGRGGRRIADADALAHIAGITAANEGTIRDWVRHGKFNVTQGKNFVASGAMGPWMTTADAIRDVHDLHVRTRVNGEVRQHDTTARLAFPFARLIAYISTFTALAPGDVILTGTPAGAGARFDPPRYLVPGDVVEVEVDQVGVLHNSVIDEAA